MIDTYYSLVRNTPVVKLPEIDPVEVEIYAGLSCHNPSGSIKDVMAWYMFEKAEQRGELKRGDTILEITTGNTGIAFAMLAAIHGYRFVAVMPEHMSVERRQMMHAYGAEVVLTPEQEDMPGAMRKYEELRHELHPGVWLPNQFGNEDNVQAHYLTTGANLVQHVPGHIDFFIAGIGTGGTFLGTARKIREDSPDCVMIAVEPEESQVLAGGAPGLHGIQGIGEGFVPELVEQHRNEIDRVESVSTSAAEEISRKLVLKTGILGGVSSGANISVALKYARENPGSRIATLIPDRGERYLNQGLFGCSAVECAEGKCRKLPVFDS